MSKYKVGDKVVLTITSMDEKGYPIYVLNNKFYISEQGIDDETEPLSTYILPLEDKIRRQAAEITRLLAKNKGLKEDFEKSKRITLNMGRLAGQNEAWELARKIVIQDGYSAYDLYEIFGCNDLQHVLENYTYPEAAAKVAEWEKAKEEIKVGGCVRRHSR